MKIFAVVGPSGSGKDTIINYVVKKLPIKKVKRVITRPINKFEDFESVSDEEFDKRRFLIKWEAHGNKYGIPFLESGDYIINVSRSAINELKKNNNVFVIELKTNKKILYQRLIKRGRDNLEEIKERMNRKIKINSNFMVDTSNPNVSIAGEKVVNYIKSKLFK